jgi:hypothetical protein
LIPYDFEEFALLSIRLDELARLSVIGLIFIFVLFDPKIAVVLDTLFNPYTLGLAC